MHRFVTPVVYSGYHQAIKKGYLSKTDSDLIAAARPGTGAKKQMEIPSEESVKLLIENSDGIWKAFWSIAVKTGIRLGELTTLHHKILEKNDISRISGQNKTPDQGGFSLARGRLNQPLLLPLLHPFLGYRTIDCAVLRFAFT